MDTIKCFASGIQAKNCKDFAVAVKTFSPKAYPIKRYGGSSSNKVMSARLAKSNSGRTF